MVFQVRARSTLLSLLLLLAPNCAFAHLRRGQTGHDLAESRLHQEAPVTAEHFELDAEKADATVLLQRLVQHPHEISNLLNHTEAAALHASLSAFMQVDATAPSSSATSPLHHHVSQFFAALQAEPTSSNMFGIDTSKLKVSQFTPMLMVMAVIAIAGCVAFEVGHSQHYNQQLQQTPVDFGEEVHEQKLSRLFSGIIPLIRPYLCQQEDKNPWWYISVLAVLGVWELGMGFVMTLWSKEFWDIMENKRFDEFYGVMKVFVLLLSSWILVSTYRSYVGMMFLIHWRSFMTAWFLKRWLAYKAYYRMQLEPNDPWMGQSAPDNPDQRIQEDIHVFVSSFLSLSTGLLASAGGFVTMLPLLLVLSPTYAFGVFYCPGWLLYCALLYSGMGTVAAHMIGKKLILVNFARQKYEANFRYNIVQVRDNAESIALYNSERCEEERLKGTFQGIVHVWYLLMIYTKRLGFFGALYGHSSFIFPYIVLAPNYFRGQISLGTLFMLFRALNAVKDAFDWVINTYSGLTDFRATVDRLHNFQCALDMQELADVGVKQLKEAPPNAEGAVLAVAGLTVKLPKCAGSRVLWEEADIKILPGEFVLLTAPEGSGKSCFFRAISGIWPAADGAVYTPEDTLFVPQKSFIPQGSLKQAVTYPESMDAFADEKVVEALKAVGLTTLADKNLGDESQWQLVLSGGEQQRLAIAHVILKRPKLLFLDEATSAMGREGALEIYSLLRREGTLQKGSAVVSISHQADLLGSVHDLRYTYNANKAIWVEALET